MNKPKISLITISYNHAEFIRKTIDSVLEQNYPNFEHIVIDGGSTDDTINILKSYSHLNWVSEPDTGISNALNKGLKKATGEIVAWINSDDWYEPGTFDIVAEALRDNHVVIGNAVEADRQGNPIKTVKNFPRTYFDLLRYWVPHGWIAQPSVFFTKAALESVKLANGDYIDETYHYSMDYELWLRLGKLYPFTNHVDKVFSHYRIYGENKTGRVFASPQRELGRAFRNSTNRYCDIERKVSIVLPVAELGEPFVKGLHSIIEQEIRDYDLVVVNTSTDKETCQRLKDAINELEEATTVTNFRLISAPGASIPQAQKIGIEASRAQLITVLRAGDVVQKDFMLNVINTFAHDTYGAGFLLPEGHPFRKSLSNSETGLLNVNALISLEAEFIPFVFRKIILEELGSYAEGDASWVTFREFILHTVNQGWLVRADCELALQELAPVSAKEEMLERLRVLFSKTYLFAAGARYAAQDIFYPIRSESPYAPCYPSDQAKIAEEMFSGFPKDWLNLDFTTSVERLQGCVKETPYFKPAWYLLISRLKDLGKAQEAAAMREQFIRAHPDMTEIPLP